MPVANLEGTLVAAGPCIELEPDAAERLTVGCRSVTDAAALSARQSDVLLTSAA